MPIPKVWVKSVHAFSRFTYGSVLSGVPKYFPKSFNSSYIKIVTANWQLPATARPRVPFFSEFDLAQWLLTSTLSGFTILYDTTLMIQNSLVSLKISLKNINDDFGYFSRKFVTTIFFKSYFHRANFHFKSKFKYGQWALQIKIIIPFLRNEFSKILKSLFKTRNLRFKREFDVFHFEICELLNFL